MQVADRTWACKRCTFVNISQRERCLQCNGKRPNDRGFLDRDEHGHNLMHGEESPIPPATIQCEWPQCGIVVLLAEYEDHAEEHIREDKIQKDLDEIASREVIKRAISKNINFNQNQNKNQNDYHNVHGINANIYNAEPAPMTIKCDYPDCGETVLWSEYGLHSAKHLAKGQKNQSRDHDQDKPVSIKCDFPGCGKNVPYDEYAEHGMQHINGNRYPNRMGRGDDRWFFICQLLVDAFTLTRFQAWVVAIGMAVVAPYAKNVVRGVLYCLGMIVVVLLFNLVTLLGRKFGTTVKNNIKSKLKLIKWNNNLGNVPTVVWILFIIVFGILYFMYCNQKLLFEQNAAQDEKLHQHGTTLKQHGATLKEHGTRIEVLEHTLAQLQHQVSGLGDAFFDLTKRVGDVETLTKELQSGLMKTAAKVDKNFDVLQTKIQQNYEAVLKKSEMAQWADDIMMNTIGRIKSNPRYWIGIGGCFVEGTGIAVGAGDEDGEFIFVNVEELQSGEYVYNPFLKENMKIRRWIYGYETGIIYNVTTSDGLSVVVTETHPMIICHENESDIIMSVSGANCMNIPAKDVFAGNTTMTMNGKQEIIKIDQIEVKDAVVYNFMYVDGEEELPVMYRGVNANGIYTLDLYAQSLHHTTAHNEESDITDKTCLVIGAVSFLWLMSKRD